MTKPKFKFEIGDRTTDVWHGDLITECVFLANLPFGQMLFYDIQSKVFRRVFIDVDDNGNPYMDGWTCAECPSELFNKQ